MRTPYPGRRWPGGKGAYTKVSKFGPHAQAYIALGRAMSAPPTRSTKATRLREDATRVNQERLAETEMRTTAQVQIRSERALRLKPDVIKAVKINDRTMALDAAKRLRSRVGKHMIKVNEHAYERELMAMQQRVEHKPLLFEQDHMPSCVIRDRADTKSRAAELAAKFEG